MFSDRINIVSFRRIVTALFFIVLSVSTVSAFWKQALLLSFFLIALAFLKHVISPIKREFAIFVIIGILGPSTESLIILFGSGPWTYAEPFFLNIPIWLLPLWGLAGTIFMTLYQGIFDS